MIRRLSSKGQVAIPLEIQEKAGIGPGSAVEVVFRKGEVVLTPMPESDTGRLSSLVQRLRGSATIRMSTDEILAHTRRE